MDLQELEARFLVSSRGCDNAVDLASARRTAAVFIDNLPIADLGEARDRHYWVSNWIRTADSYYSLANLDVRSGAVERAREAWLCAMTGFEVAKRIVESGDPDHLRIVAKMQACVDEFGLHHARAVEQVRIGCCDEQELTACYLPHDGSAPRAPSIICISKKCESIGEFLGRLLPAAVGRGMSLLVVEGKDLADHPTSKSDSLLGCCVDYLSDRPDVDHGRIGVYGAGMAAAEATSLAASDRRIRAAVCDGGLWQFAWTRSSIDCMAGVAGELDDDEAMSARRMRLVRRMRCPILVVAGPREFVDLSEALSLHADCKAAGIDMSLVVSRTVETPLGGIENFLTADEFIFGWLERKMKACRPSLSLRYL